MPDDNPKTRTLRAELPPLPKRMADLPVEERGYPVPAFVAWIDGKPEFRVADSGFREVALREPLCWVCGHEFSTRHRHYVIGPMCTVNRTTSEPAVHLDCAMFSIGGCPFLMRPHASRRANDLPEEQKVQPGHIDRNPGVMALYSTREHTVHRTGRFAGEYLISLGEPEDVQWFAQGRPATYAEAVASVHSGFSLLLNLAEQQDAEERNGGKSLHELRVYMHRMLPSLPRLGRDDLTAIRQIMEMGEMTGEAMRRVQEAAHD